MHSNVYLLETDACGSGVGGVLSVKREGQLLPRHSTPANCMEQKESTLPKNWRG